IKKLVHVSSIAAIGRSRDGARLEEASSWQKSKLNSNYAISKFLAEQEVWRGMAEGLKAAIVNPSVILGAGRWDEGALQYFGLIWNKFPFYPVGATGFVDVRDLAVAMIRLMESNITGERFIISSENRTYRSVFNKIAECLDKRPPYLAANRLIRPFAWRLSWLQQKIFGGKRTITRETALLSSKTFYFDNSKSAEQLGMQYRPLDTTIEESSLKFIRSASHSFSSAVLPVT
ncbi:MAG: NAD-dependent epimerase/dehydratase family protein, partial [Saprospiraceae bacterium]|nr:NAD-dependent epimerase/dehydratase family protein [Saprospiraceae bacterium]